MLTPMECQEARPRLQWTRERLANEADVNIDAVIGFELGLSQPPTHIVAALTGALEAAETALPSRPAFNWHLTADCQAGSGSMLRSSRAR